MGSVRNAAASAPAGPRIYNLFPSLVGSIERWSGQLAYGDAWARAGLVAYWSDYLALYLGLGVGGFRCDAAYKVPVEAWRRLMGAARSANPATVFFAETVGGSPADVEALRGAGFD